MTFEEFTELKEWMVLHFATKDDIALLRAEITEKFATKEDLKQFATKEDLDVVKYDVSILKADLAAFKQEMREFKNETILQISYKNRCCLIGMRSELFVLKSGEGTLFGLSPLRIPSYGDEEIRI